MKNYRNTLNLPKTNFPMRAALNTKEPVIYELWKKKNIYKLIRNCRITNKVFNLHDGPPYANGSIHIGHALNKILKDIILKFKIMSGYNINYIPGWDCHGLPIEHQVLQQNKHLFIPKLTSEEKINFINLCRKYAYHQVDNQKQDFMRLGILADWDNSYLTMDYKNQATIIRTLGLIANKGYLYLSEKPVHWCFKCNSSLAEAEIEYNLISCKSLYVLMELKLNSLYNKLFDVCKGLTVHLVIWTTTPWSLIANQAVAVHPNYFYNVINIDNKLYLIETNLTSHIISLLRIKTWNIIMTLQGKQLENIKYYHPFRLNNICKIILSDHVTNQQGTGQVHIAPDHGLEDFLICKKYNIKVIKTINKYGYFINNQVPILLKGLTLQKSEKPIIHLLQLHNKLLYTKKIDHSYPYCWRHQIPVIYRSTPQWFLNMEHNNLRQKCLDNINKVNWIPKISKHRISSMLEQRPDWCISRQRLWGVPLTLIIDKKNNFIHSDILKITNNIASRVEKQGIQTWWDIKIEELLKHTTSHYKKTQDVLDVWFDSGCSFLFIDQKDKIDLYIEGNDQHRGWFMSSLIISTILNNEPPYQTVITHGFVVDDTGKKMSKSKNNIVVPKKVIDIFGVDILRLWVASNNYITEINLSYNKIQSIIDIYRRIRNTVRYLLSNLFDFNPLNDIISSKKLLIIDKWVLSTANILQQDIINCYKNYNFHEVIQKIMNFCSITMGSIYLEIIKDRQYTLPSNSLARKSCQTSIFYLLEALIKWIMPILPFTAYEIWSYYKRDSNQEIFTEVWSNKLQNFLYKEPINENVWQILFFIKNKIHALIENIINKKLISKSLELGINLIINNDILCNIFQVLERELHYFFLVSKLYINNIYNIPSKWILLINETLSYKKIDINISIYKIDYLKCARCWHHVNDIGTNIEHPLICNRCINNITTFTGEKRKYF